MQERDSKKDGGLQRKNENDDSLRVSRTVHPRSWEEGGCDGDILHFEGWCFCFCGSLSWLAGSLTHRLQTAVKSIPLAFSLFCSPCVATFKVSKSKEQPVLLLTYYLLNDGKV